MDYSAEQNSCIEANIDRLQFLFQTWTPVKVNNLTGLDHDFIDIIKLKFIKLPSKQIQNRTATS